MIDIPEIGREEEVAVRADITGEVEICWSFDIERGSHWMDSSGMRRSSLPSMIDL